MPRRIYLLTFSHCPASTGQGLDEFRGRMASRSLVFENHYLQRPLAECPFEALGGDTSFARLRALVSAGGVSVRMVLVGNVGDEVTRQLPQWLNVLPTANGVGEGMIDPASELPTQVSAPCLFWVHAVLPADANADQLSGLVIQVREFASDTQDLLMVTFLNGGSVCQPDRFQSLLFEGDVRVPLWIQSSHPPCRIQTPTGSFDIAATIADELEGVDREVEAQETGDAAVNVLRLAEGPGTRSDRFLFIDAGDVSAVRTSGFLFAHSGDGLDRVSALYAKPEDVWNMNDVSAGYHAVVEELGDLLRPDRADDQGATASVPA
jgi:hypothetical protein